MWRHPAATLHAWKPTNVSTFQATRSISTTLNSNRISSVRISDPLSCIPAAPTIHISRRNFGFKPIPRKRRKKIKEFLERYKAEQEEKRMVSLAEKEVEVDQSDAVAMEEGVKRAVRLSPVYFDASIVVSFLMNLDPRHANEIIRGNVQLPHGTGEKRVICAFVKEVQEDEARAAGADIIGDEEILQGIENGIIPFDICIATPDQMSKLTKYGRYLGPKGLMPNIKMGTLTTDFVKAIRDSKGGQVGVRIDENHFVAAKIGKASFGEDNIMQNFLSFLAQLRDELRPAGAKHQYFLKAFVGAEDGIMHQVRVSENMPWRRPKAGAWST